LAAENGEVPVRDPQPAREFLHDLLDVGTAGHHHPVGVLVHLHVVDPCQRREGQIEAQELDSYLAKSEMSSLDGRTLHVLEGPADLPLAGAHVHGDDDDRHR